MSEQTLSPMIAVRFQPVTCWIEIPKGQQALVVRRDHPEKLLPSGSQQIQGFFQSRPEIYYLPTASLPLFLWLTDLFAVGGVPLSLSWKLSIKLKDAERFHERWLRFQETDTIPLPGELISARLADPTQELVQRFGLEDLRTDKDVRRLLGGKLSLLVKEQLDLFGLEIADQPDFDSLRFHTQTDLMNAERERHTLQRMVEDEVLQTLIHRVDNAETLTYRLREWLAEANESLESETVDQVVAETLAGHEEPVAQVLAEQEAEMPLAQATPAPIDLDEIVDTELDHHHGPFHVFQHIGQIVMMAALLAALTLAGIAVFEPQWLSADLRHYTVAIVMGVGMGGLFIAWIFDQIMRWEANRAAQRIMKMRKMDDPDIHMNRLEVRHMLVLLGALLGVVGSGISLWMPDFYPALRFGGAMIGLVGAAIAIRLDWIHNMEDAARLHSCVQRRTASAYLSAAQRERRHYRFQVDLTAETQVTLDFLAQLQDAVYRRTKDRRLVVRIQEVHAQVTQLLPQIERMQRAQADMDDEEWAALDDQSQALQAQIRSISDLAQRLLALAQNDNGDALRSRVDQLELSTQQMRALLTRWDAVVA